MKWSLFLLVMAGCQPPKVNHDAVRYAIALGREREEEGVMIPINADVAAKVAARKADFDKGKVKLRTRDIQIYVCAYCRRRGLQLVRTDDGRYLVCSDKVACAEAKKKLEADAPPPNVEKSLKETAEKLGLRVE